MERIERFGADRPADAARALSRDGVIVFDQLFDSALIADLGTELRRIVPGAYDQTAKQPEDYLQVGKNRINGLVPIGRRMAPALDILVHPTLECLFSEALGEDWVYESFGVISSFPGATQQQLHTDDYHLFDGTAHDGTLPTYALTISIPLVSVNAVNGGTEFLLGSHHASRDSVVMSELVTSELTPGDCMIWDFMTHHRGQANNSDAPRPMLYVTACRRFWSDYRNFGTAGLKLVIDSSLVRPLPLAQRKRLKRFKPMPGLRTGLGSVSRALRWYAPSLHRELMKLVRRQENPR